MTVLVLLLYHITRLLIGRLNLLARFNNLQLLAYV